METVQPELLVMDKFRDLLKRERYQLSFAGGDLKELLDSRQSTVQILCLFEEYRHERRYSNLKSNRSR